MTLSELIQDSLKDTDLKWLGNFKENKRKDFTEKDKMVVVVSEEPNSFKQSINVDNFTAHVILS
jgi:hypothetical protein